MNFFKNLALVGLVILFGIGCYIYGFYRGTEICYKQLDCMSFVTNLMYYQMSLASDKERIQKKALCLWEDAIDNLVYKKNAKFPLDNKTIKSLISNRDDQRIDGILHTHANVLNNLLIEYPSLKFNDSTLKYINSYKVKSCKSVPRTVLDNIEESKQFRNQNPSPTPQ